MKQRYRLHFLGAGSAFTVGANNYQSNLLLERNQHDRLLIDCGSDARLALHDLGFQHRDIHAVYISHLHSDHIGGLEWLAFKTYFDAECNKPSLYLHESLVDSIWNNALSAGLSSLQSQQAQLSTYFDVKPVICNKNFLTECSFTWANIEFVLVQSLHVVSGFRIMPCFGLMFRLNGCCVYFTSDTQLALSQSLDYLNQADIIFHDCETSPIKSGVHAHFDELRELPQRIRQKMWLYHYNAGLLPDAVKQGFLGFVKKGQAFDF